MKDMNMDKKKINIREALELNEPNAPQEPPKKNTQPQNQSRPGRQPATEQEGETWNVWRTQGEFINRLTTQRSAINKAIQNGEPLEDVLLLALECIATMTGDKLFFTANKEKLKHRADSENFF